MERKLRNGLLIIDMQNDFVLANGALSVVGAEDDAKRVAEFIKRNCKAIDGITLTMDSHYPYHIAHPIFWKDKDGNHPAPFTTITLQDLKDGKWHTTIAPTWPAHYLEELDKQGKSLVLWNPHCLISTQGWAIQEDVINAVINWSETTGQVYRIECKGSNILTEHFSVLESCVPVPNCPETQLNQNLLNVLNSFEHVYLFGEAANYCVLNTLADLNKYTPDLVSKLIILEDCMSAIGAWDINTDPVYQKAVSLGAKIVKSTEVTL